MPRVSDLVQRLSRLNATHATASLGDAGRLTELEAFGANPGALRAKSYVPERLADRPGLVVVLHGCTQTAASYDLGAGWSELADRFGFAVLFPEQQRQNNPSLCFNWFVPEDTRRGSGEAQSIREMIATMIDRYNIDATRVFVTGLSAGGAMTSVMLATYPEVFAGGAIIAGLPYGCATTVPQAFDRMRNGGTDDVALAARVRDASRHAGPWPTISIWHGSADATVNPSNADAIIGQWRALHGVDASPDRTEMADGYPRRVWCDDQGREVIEEYRITGMGHGAPLETLSDEGCGKSGAYMLEARISSTLHVCRFWGLTREGETTSEERVTPKRLALPEASERASAPTHSPRAAGGSGSAKQGVGAIIEDALRAAGLMR